MTVKARDIPSSNGQKPPPEPPRRGPDWSLLLIKAGGWLAVIAFGGLFWLVNGGFSVRGLEEVSAQFGPGGLLFWQVVSGPKLPWQFAIPGLPATQPLFPWLGVVAASMIQIGIVWRGLQGRPIPVWVLAVGFILSLYDLTTTWFGFGTLQWVKWAGRIVQTLVSLLFTFGLELLIGFLLRGRRPQRS